MKKTLLIGAAALSFAAACGGSSDPCSGVSGTCKGLPSGSTEANVSAAFSSAQPNSTIAFGSGTFEFTNTLTLAAAGVTIKGAGAAQTILDFKGQTAGSEGIYVSDHSDGTSITDLTVQDTKGNAIKIIGSTGVYFRRLTITWTASDSTTHGPYGLYPVSCKNVLIEDSTVSGASDSGIYVGQSDTIIVRRNTATKNVAGIEIENSFNADVMNNTATANTGGILVFDLPNLPQKGGHNVRVFNNIITSNNTGNFAAKGDIVGLVPAGTGAFVMANHDVEVFGNTFTGNSTAAFSVVSFYVTQENFTDAAYYPLPARVHAHDNIFTGNGTAPDQGSLLGLLLGSAKASFTGGRISDLTYDGIVDPTATGGTAANPMQICFEANGAGATFANLHFDMLNGLATNLGAILTTDATANTCSLPALPAITVPGA